LPDSPWGGGAAGDAVAETQMPAAASPLLFYPIYQYYWLNLYGIDLDHKTVLQELASDSCLEPIMFNIWNAMP